MQVMLQDMYFSSLCYSFFANVVVVNKILFGMESVDNEESEFFVVWEKFQ